jgi:cytochrome c oxidase assembly protein subunit 15
MNDTTPVWLRRFTKFVAASTLFLIFAGAMVTSTGSGLAVPDWPLSYGMVMPPMIGGIFYEHGHRMIAATVGLLTVIQAVWLQRREPKRRVRILGWTAVAAVIAQGVLGGITVLFLLPPAVSIAHAGLAEVFFCLNLSIAVLTSRRYASLRETPEAVGGTRLFVALAYLQILAGALMRHLGAGLAIPDFPLSFGQIVPAFTSVGIAVNFVHRAGGLAVAIAAVAMAVRLLRLARGNPLRRFALPLVALVAVQVLLGASTVWSGRHPVVTSLHVMTGAATLGLALMLALAARAAAPERGGLFVAREVTA